MSESTIVALAILILVFVTIIASIMKGGIEAAIKMWSVMGALTGVAFGAITTYYFTDQIRKTEVAALEEKATRLTAALARVNVNAGEAQSALQQADGVANAIREAAILLRIPAEQRGAAFDASLMETGRALSKSYPQLEQAILQSSADVSTIQSLSSEALSTDAKKYLEKILRMMQE